MFESYILKVNANDRVKKDEHLHISHCFIQYIFIESDRVKKDENYLTVKHDFAGAHMTGDLPQRQLINNFGTEFTCLKGSWLT